MLDRFVNEYSERAFYFAYRLSGDVEEAKELVQEAFARCLRKWDQYDSSQPLENWFLAVLRNVYADAVKRYDRRNCVSLYAPAENEGLAFCDTLASGEEAVLTALERRETAAVVQGVLEELKVEYRAILSMCDIEALSYDHIAGVLGCPLGTVRSRVNRARAAFKAKLLERMKDEVNHAV